MASPSLDDRFRVLHGLETTCCMSRTPSCTLADEMATHAAPVPDTVGAHVSRVPRSCRTRTVLLLLAGDVVAWGLAGLAGIGIAGRLGVTLGDVDLALALLGLALAPFAYGGVGLYPAAGVNRVDELRRLTKATSGVWLVLVAAAALGHGYAKATPLALTWAFALATVPLGRAVVRHVWGSRAWFGVPVVILGAGQAGGLVVRRLQQLRSHLYRPVAAFDDDPTLWGGQLHGVPIVGPLADAPSYVERGVRHAIVAMPSLRAQKLMPLLRELARAFPSVILLPEFGAAASVGVQPRTLGGLSAFQIHHALLRRRNLVLKRALDLVALVPAALIAGPVVALAALAVRAVSPGSPFYAQEREGRCGRTFRMWKLRTMHHDADELLRRHLETDPEAAAEWATRYKLSRDPRILPVVGSLLRKTSLDELPQLWNIARGEMSFVGPRPFPAYHLDAFGPEFRELRRRVLPGLTGLWQVTARADADLALQEELDTVYIANWSVWMDVYLFARTPWSVLRGSGAY